MRVELFKKGSFRTAEWTGGTTTELFIYPPASECGARDFEARISSATVEIEESIFSDFDGYVRHITPLEGGIRLIHENHGKAALQPFEVDTFDGCWRTRAYGRCVDFNLIHRDGWRGGIVPLEKGASFDCPAGGFTGLYILSEDVSVVVHCGGETHRHPAGRGDFALVESLDGAGCSASVEDARKRQGVLAVLAWISKVRTD